MGAALLILFGLWLVIRTVRGNLIGRIVDG
jgi:ABC-type nickel/cobalt efflux system permease component RcnA